jgi:hypothetical protein
MPLHLLIQALLAGAASLLFIGGLTGGIAEEPLSFLHTAMLWSLFFHFFIIIFGELLMPHPNRDVAQAIRLIVAGPFKTLFRGGVVLGGNLLPFVLLLVLEPSSFLSLVVSVLALAGLFAFEHLWVTAGQAVPLS